MTASAQAYRGATATLCLGPLRNLTEALQRCRRLLEQGLRFVELRDDLLTDQELTQCAHALPREQTLLSLRRPRTDQVALVDLLAPALLDVACELGEMPPALAAKIANSLTLKLFRSCHTRTDQESVSALLDRLTAEIPEPQIIKVAIPIANLAELRDGHRWRLQNPQRHIFLPIASDGSGRFRFYRLLTANQQLLHFLRDLDSPLVPDQPAPAEWTSRQQIPIPNTAPIPFAAILGNPVEHSRTPEYHAQFFARYGMPVLKVRITDEDLRSCDVLSVLRDLGLRAAAVTSPLKTWLRESIVAMGGAWEVIDAQDPQDAGNTMVVHHNGNVIGCSTDGTGLRASWRDTLRDQSGVLGAIPNLAVFGGGGLLSLLQSVFPSALFLSARTGKVRTSQPELLLPDHPPNISAVIWSVGRSRYRNAPPPWLRPQLVFDLNYSADSPGREFAQAVGAQYVDGSRFFEYQAAAQQQFWRRHLPPVHPETEQNPLMISAGGNPATRNQP